MPNRLARETSPYLLQHKDNPVDWFPWGDEAFETARAQDRPIFLSVGYSACHWCHVMERESFENPATADLMNRLFVNIKVDREERPDVDSIYMAATQAMTGSGGWPMSVFLTPDGKPFYAGTYFPDEDRHGLPAFKRVLRSMSDAYRERRGDVLEATKRIAERLNAASGAQTSTDPLSRDLMIDAYTQLPPRFDAENGGFDGAPKFPQPLLYEFILRYAHSFQDNAALEMVATTLTRMARGGIYDQLGGGFHRYSVDARWLVPHFEKMLYDNAQLALLYLHAWQFTGNDFFRRVAQDILGYVRREMSHPSGGFYSAQDADSEGREGAYFVWSISEIEAVVGADLARVARAYWGVADEGNFEGKNILHAPRADDVVAAELGMSVDDLRRALEGMRSRLLAAREERVRPGLDDKVLTSWNALMMKAFAEAGAVFQDESCLDAARRNAAFLLANLVDGDRLLRTWKASGGGGRARLLGYLEDHAFLVDALISLYEATFEDRWLNEATALARRMIDLFWERNDRVFYDTGKDHEELIVRPRHVFDDALPCGGSAAAVGLLRLARLTGDSAFSRHAVDSLRSVRDWLPRSAAGFGNWLAALDIYSAPSSEVVIVGPRRDPATNDLLRVVRGRYAPNTVVAGQASTSDAPSPPLLEGRDMIDGRPTAYVCENYACQMPVTSPDSLARQLDLVLGPRR